MEGAFLSPPCDLAVLWIRGLQEGIHILCIIFVMALFAVRPYSHQRRDLRANTPMLVFVTK